MLKLLSKLKRKFISPNFYALVFSVNGTNKEILWMGIAYTMDEALKEAKKDSFERYRITPDSLSLSISARRNVKKIITEYINSGVVEEKNKDKSINELMLEIIKNKNTKLFKKNEKRFTEMEKEFIKSYLKAKN